MHRGAVEEKTKQRHILKKGVELIFGDGLTKKRTEDVADARQSPWGNGKSFLKELLGLFLVSGYFTCDVRASLKCGIVKIFYQKYKFVKKKIVKKNEWGVSMRFRSKRVQHSILISD